MLMKITISLKISNDGIHEHLNCYRFLSRRDQDDDDT